MKSRKMVTTTIGILLITTFLFTSGFAFTPMQSKLFQQNQLKAKPALELPLTDIKGHWAEAGIMEMYIRDVMTGYEDGTFRPKKPVTYLDAVVMIDRLLWGKPIKTDLFDKNYLLEEYDVPTWALGYVSSALRHQIIYYGDLQKLSLKQPITRQEAAVLIVRALELTGQLDAVRDLPLTFTDLKDISESKKGYISLVCQRSIMSGFPDGSFQPNGPVSRAEMALLLNNLVDSVSYLKLDETSGFIKSVNISEGFITLGKSDGQDVKIVLPSNYLVYLNDKSSAIDKLVPGSHLRMISSDSCEFTLFLAQTVAKDEGLPVAFESILAFPSPDIQKWVDENKVKEKYLVKVGGNEIYLLATRGEKMTGGYKVDIVKLSMVKYEKGNLYYKVSVSRSNPGRDSVVNQVISYPYSLIKFQKPKEKVNSIIFLDELSRTLAEIKL